MQARAGSSSPYTQPDSPPTTRQARRQDRTRLTTELRAPLEKDAPRRYAPVSEADPDRVRLVRVCALRDAQDPSWPTEVERLWRDNTRLSQKFAHGFQRRTGADHIPKEDFEQAASVGLLTAIQRFDPSKAGKLSTYAVWWMRHECEDLLKDEDLVRVPTQVQEDRVRVRAVLKDDPGLTPEEIATKLAASDDEAARKVTPERVRLALRAVPSRRHAEVDPRRDKDEAVEALDESPVQQLLEALERLPPRERAALAQEYGLAGWDSGEVEDADPVAQRALRELGLRRMRRMVREG